jgi:WD40 repeat protein
LLASFAALAVMGPVTGRSTPIAALAFSPDGQILVSNGERSVVIRSPVDGTVRQQVPCEIAKITALAFAPMHKLFAVAGGRPGVEGCVFLWDGPQGQPVRRFDAGTDLITDIAFSPDGRTLAAAGSDHQTRIFPVDSGAEGASAPLLLDGHAGPVLAVAFSPEGSVLITTSADRSVKVWDTRDGRLIRTFGQHTEAVHALAFRPLLKGQGRDRPLACATAGDDRTVRLWQPAVGRMVRIIRRHEGPILALAFSPDGRGLFSAGREGIILHLDPDSDVVRNEVARGGDWIYALAVSPDGRRLASGDWAGIVRVHSLGGSDVR